MCVAVNEAGERACLRLTGDGSFVMAFDATAVANTLLEKSFQEHVPIDPMKMQKLVYIAHGYTLVDRDEPLVDELFEAWTFGPVLPSLYHKCKSYRSGEITELLKRHDHTTRRSYPPVLPPGSPFLDQIGFTWRNYGAERAIDLSNWTHEQGGPWDRVRREQHDGRFVYRNQPIPNEFIKEYFQANLYE